MKTLLFLFLLSLLVLVSCKKDKVTPPVDDTYFPKVKTIIQNNCLQCHSSTGAWTGRPVQFDTDTQIVAAYASIKASVVDPVTYINKRMPEGSSLSQIDIDIIVNWYNKGGKASD